MMREYYYLKALDRSPYNLTTEDALHLGATEQLSVYVYIHQPIFLYTVFELDDDIVYDDGFFLRLTSSTLSALEKLTYQEESCNTRVDVSNQLTSQGITVESGFIDDRYNGLGPNTSPFDTNSEEPFFVEIYTDDPAKSRSIKLVKSPIISMSDLICWTDDLEKLNVCRPLNDESKDSSDVALNATSIRRTQRVLVSLVIALSKKEHKYRRGQKLNKSAIAEFIAGNFIDENGREMPGLSVSTIRDTINEALEAFPELFENSK